MEDWEVSGETPEETIPNKTWEDAFLYGSGFYLQDHTGATKHIAAQSVTVTMQSQTPDEGEWPARDAVPQWHSLSPRGVVPKAVPIGAGEVEVTEEMLFAGSDIILDPCSLSPNEMASAIYRAMAALAPVPLVSDGELAAVRERDMWRSIAETYENRIKELESYSHDLAVAHDKHTTEINTLRIELAQRPAPVPDTPASVPNPFREHRSDSRRMGNA